jgi:hypothetical protein
MPRESGNDRLARVEAEYRHWCDQIAWRHGIVVRAEGDTAFLDTNEGSKVICRPDDQKRFWYRTWLALKYVHGYDDENHPK